MLWCLVFSVWWFLEISMSDCQRLLRRRSTKAGDTVGGGSLCSLIFVWDWFSARPKRGYCGFKLPGRENLRPLSVLNLIRPVNPEKKRTDLWSEGCGNNDARSHVCTPDAYMAFWNAMRCETKTCRKWCRLCKVKAITQVQQLIFVRRC